jgi:Asp-tRNA(Asn)/Glu-tRNA(Gln) amidotransferase A subunit family amidase
MPTTFGSEVFKDFVPLRDATVVTKLKGAGAIILAKATMGEFANGYVGSAFGITRNAYDPTRHPSGSSGGSATGVAANFAAVGIGEDTGGSTRGPAAVQNLVGVRPTVPLVSKYGMMPGTPTRDTIGPIAKTVKDAATVLGVIAGYDPQDPVTAYTVGQIPVSYTASLDQNGLKGARIGVIRKPMDSRADPKSEDFQKVQAVKDTAFAALQALGAELVDVALPERESAGRGGGARAGSTGGAGSGAETEGGRGGGGGGGETEQAIDKYLSEQPNAPVKTFREILLSGKVQVARARQLMGSVGRTTDHPAYLRGLATREEARVRLLKLMADHRLDAVVYATFDHQTGKIPPDVMTRIGDVYGVLGNNRGLSPSVGFPAMTIPAGFTADGMPVGLEFLGRPFTEGLLFKYAYAFEQRTRHRKPPGTTPALPGEP